MLSVLILKPPLPYLSCYHESLLRLLIVISFRFWCPTCLTRRRRNPPCTIDLRDCPVHFSGFRKLINLRGDFCSTANETAPTIKKSTKFPCIGGGIAVAL